MSTPLRLIGSPRNIVGACHLTPTNRLNCTPSGDPWSPSSLLPVGNTPLPKREVYLKEPCTGPAKTRGARRLPWSDGGKHACKYSICQTEILAEPLPHYASVDSPDRNELLENVLSGQRLCNVLGKGTFGTVFTAVYHGKLVAAKISTPHPKAMRQLMNESSVIGLQHPNIVTIIKVILPNDASLGILIMEHVMGYSLQKLLDLGSDFQSHQKRVKYSLQIARALEYCHGHRILHLDVKPKNVLVHHFLETCKLCDFGCSTRVGEAQFSVQGTVQYVAPELLRGEMPTPAADVYSLAITMWQLASREYPYQGEGEHSIIYKVVAHRQRPALPTIESSEDELFFALIQECWSQFPQSRLRIEEVTSMLASWLQD